MKYKVGDEILWVFSRNSTVYKVTQTSSNEYKIKLIYSSNPNDAHQVDVYEDWHKQSYIEGGSRKLTKLDKALR